MPGPPVVVLYMHALFGQGIAQLLQSGTDLDVACLPIGDGNLHARLKRRRPRVIILEAPRESDVWRFLNDLPPATVIRVSLDDDVMDVFCRHRIVRASPAILADAVHAGLGLHRTYAR